MTAIKYLVTFPETEFSRKDKLYKDLASKICIQGACLQRGQYLQLRLKKGANMSNVKSILRKHFNINYRLEYDEDGELFRYAPQEDIFRLCEAFLKHNCVELDYYNRFDPLGERNTVAKIVYQYGEVRYDLLKV